MKVEYLLSFKDHDDLKNLDDEFLNLISENFIKSYSKKVKKKLIKPILKCNLLKNSKLQTEKNTIESKVNLILNKLSKNNFDQIIEEFIIKFSEIEQYDFNIILKSLFVKAIKDEKFINIFLKFYNIINQIYSYLFDFNNKYFIDILETKIKFDYQKIKLDTEYSFLENLNSEENRINSLKILIYLVEKNNLKINVINVVSDYLMETDYIPDINFWFSNKFIKNKLDIKNFNEKLVNKLSNEINNRSLVLLKNLLDSNDIQYELNLDEELDEDSDEENSIFNNLDDETTKSDFEIQIDNILEEYLLLEEFDEVSSLIETFNKDENKKKIFMETLLNFFFNSTLNNVNKFKKLFVNLKKSKKFKIKIYKNSLIELLNNDDRFDYTDLENKILKITDIYKIIKIKINTPQKSL